MYFAITDSSLWHPSVSGDILLPWRWCAGSSTQIVLLFTFLSIFAFSFILLHILSLYFIICLFLFLIHYSFIPIFLYIVLHIIALSMERTRLTFHCWLYPVYVLYMWRINLESWSICVRVSLLGNLSESESELPLYIFIWVSLPHLFWPTEAKALP